jgi:ATP-binding cassette subfamily B protein
MGMFSNLDQEAYDRQYTDRQLARRMGVYLKPYMPQIVVITILVLVNSFAGAAAPIVVAQGIDQLKADLTYKTILILFSIVLFIGILAWFTNWLRRRLTVRTVSATELQLRSDAFQAAAEHDLSFYDEFPSGKIVSRITSDTKEFSQIVVLITDLISQIVQSVILGIVLVRIDWRLSLYLFAFLPLVFIFSLAFRKIARTVTRQGMRAMANVNATIKETVSGIAIAKNFRQETSIYREFEEANVQSYRVNIKRGLVLALVFPTLNAIGGVGSALLVYAGGLSVAQGIVTAGAWFLFLQGLDQFFFPILNLSAFWLISKLVFCCRTSFALIDAGSSIDQLTIKSAKDLA